MAMSILINETMKIEISGVLREGPMNVIRSVLDMPMDTNQNM
jgi:hypothetical protein